MPQTCAPYPEDFRQRILELMRVGQTPDELAKKFDRIAQTIRN